MTRFRVLEPVPQVFVHVPNAAHCDMTQWIGQGELLTQGNVSDRAGHAVPR